MSIDALIDDILVREGGFVNHPADRGGPTHYGITQATLSRWRQQPVTVQDVQALTLEEAAQLIDERAAKAPAKGKKKAPAKKKAAPKKAAAKKAPAQCLHWTDCHGLRTFRDDSACKF